MKQNKGLPSCSWAQTLPSSAWERQMRRTAQSPMSGRLFSLLPQLFLHSSSSVSPVAPLTTLEERGASLLHFPALTLLPSSPLCSPTQLPVFSSPQPRFACFFSLLCLSLCLALSVTSGMTDPWQEKSWQTAGVLQTEVFVLYLHCKSYIFYPLDLTIRSLLSLFLCLSLTLSLILSLTELWIFIRLPQRGNIYVLLHFFLSFQALKKKRKEKGVGVGRSMSPPCGSMLNQNKCDVSKRLTLREMFPILFKELFHGWIQFVLSFLLQLKTDLLRTCFSSLHSWGCW